MDREFLLDLFSVFGPVTLRKMFSGFGISVDGVNFAMALRAGLIFRADEQTIPRFEAEGAKPFQYSTSKKTVTVASYWHVPERLVDDPDELAGWARDALAAALRAKLKKRPKARKTAKVDTDKAIASKKIVGKRTVRKSAPKRAVAKTTGKKKRKRQAT
ncbi:MAG: TfoX/Sxy family protein [Proteobacteria bacterium]|nr:TfoX/Sxy family protein [Pseudomonadota bacterium]